QPEKHEGACPLFGAICDFNSRNFFLSPVFNVVQEVSMLRLLRRPKSRSIPHSLFRTQLRLERLEGRELPSVAPVLSGALSGAKMSSPTDVAPGIISFTCTQIGAQTYVFSGVVTSPDLSSTTVRLGGLPSLSGVTCGVGADGSFSVTVSLQSG